MERSSLKIPNTAVWDELSLYSIKKAFNNMCHLIIEEW